MTAFNNLINVAELSALMGDSKCRLIDCRFNLLQPEQGHAEYLQGHIDGAVYANLDHDLAGPISAGSGRHPLPTQSAFQAVVDSWGIDRDSQIVVYDHGSGAIAARAWWMMRWVGHNNVAVLDGGIAAWCAAGLTLSTEIPHIEAAKYELQPNSEMTVTTDDILAAQEDASLALIDARDKSRFDGHSEPIDAKAGHVPGAFNLPFSDALLSDGRWRPVEELREIWSSAITVNDGQPLATMCGSGVTACHLIITAEMLGLPMPRLYVGSWSEWIRDDSRAIATAKKG